MLRNGFLLLLALTTALALSGCAGMSGDTGQEVAIATNPAGADCRFEQQGVAVARYHGEADAGARGAGGRITR